MATKPYRRLNLKLLGILLVAAAASTGGVFLVHGAQVRRTATYLLVQAEKDERAGNIDKAIGSLELYLGFRPDDNEGVIRFGRARDKAAKDSKQKLRAAETLEAAAMRDSRLTADLRRAAEIYTTIGLHKLAKPHWESFLRNPADGVAEGKLALGEEAISNYDKADALFAAGIKHAPHDIDTYLYYMRFLLSRRKSVDRAVAVADSMVAANPEADRAYAERARFRMQQKRPGADEDIARALKLNPDSIDGALLAAQLSAISGKPAEGVARLSRTIADHPDETSVIMGMAQAQFANAQVAEGLATLRNALKAHPDNLDLSLMLVESLLSHGEVDEAETLIASLRPKLGTYPPLGYAEARTYLLRRRWAEAARKLEIVSPELLRRGMPDTASAALVFAGGAYERLDAFERALGSYNGAAGISPNWVVPKLRAAAMLSALGRTSEAISAYRRLPADTPGLRAAIIRVWLAENARHPLPDLRWQEVDALVADLRRTSTQPDDVVQITAEVLIARKKFAEARTLIGKYRDEHLDRPSAPLVLATLLQAEGKADEALAAIDEAQARFGDLVAIRLARASYWARRGGKEAPTALASLREGIDKFTPDEQAEILSTLAAATARIGNSGGSSELVDASVQKAPENLQLRLQQLEIAMRSGEDARIVKIIEEIKRIEGEAGVHWRIAEANRLFRLAQSSKSTAPLKDRKEARDRVTEALAYQKDLPQAILLLAELDDAENRRDSAIANYQKLIDADVKSPIVFERMGRLQSARGRFREANDAFRKLEAMGTPSGELKKVIAEVAVLAKDEPRATGLVRAAIPADSKVVADILWQARMLSESKQPAEAEAAARRAVAIEPASAATRYALVQVLMAGGAKAKAEAEADQAEKLLPADEHLGRAQFAATIGRLDEARRRYDAALAAKPDDTSTLRSAVQFLLATDRAADTVPLLRKLIALDKGSSEAESAAKSAANRRNLATVLLISRQAKGVAEAELLVDANLANQPESLEDLTLKARVVGMQAGRGKEAIALLERVRSIRPLSDQDSYTLANLYESAGDWPSARQAVLPLLNATPPSPTVLAWYASRLLRRKEATEAGAWISRLEYVAPKAIEAAILRARWYAATSQPEKAAGLLEPKAAENAALAPIIATTLEEVGQYDAARRVIDSMVKAGRRVDAPLMMAEFLARRGQVSEALDLCDAAWKAKACEPQQVAAAMNTIFDTPAGRADPASRSRALKTLGAAIEAYPKIKSLYVTDALLLLAEGKPADAEACYRRAIELFPNDMSLLNNLAWVLCFVEGRGGDALTMIEEAIAKVGPEPHLLDTRGLAQLAIGHADLAVADFEKSVAAAPNDVAVVCIHLARARVAQGHLKEAAAAVRKAEELGFTPNALHPVELASYRTLLATLAKK